MATKSRGRAGSVRSSMTGREFDERRASIRVPAQQLARFMGRHENTVHNWTKEPGTVPKDAEIAIQLLEARPFLKESLRAPNRRIGQTSEAHERASWADKIMTELEAARVVLDEIRELGRRRVIDPALAHNAMFRFSNDIVTSYTRKLDRAARILGPDISIHIRVFLKENFKDEFSHMPAGAA